MTHKTAGGQASAKPFLTDVVTLRQRARRQMEQGAVTETYGGDVQRTIEILQSVLATELVCVLRYTQHSIVATGLSRESVSQEFAQHAREEQDHVQRVAERINQLGGAPDFNPDTLTARSAAQYQTSEDLVELIQENLIAERIAIDHYRELIRYFGNDDPATRTMLEAILIVEEEHASDMVDLLAIHGPAHGVEARREGRPAPTTYHTPH
jgi:bacterioferritin